jgi:hypothetical protein
VDPEGAQDQDRAAEEALGRGLERDRGPAEGIRQDLVNSFRLEVLQTTDGCLSTVFMRTAIRSRVPQGRLNLAQDASPGLACTVEKSRRDD